MKKLTVTQKRKYIKNSSKCPFCNSDSIEADSLDMEGDAVFQDIFCNECRASWRDMYKLVEVEAI